MGVNVKTVSVVVAGAAIAGALASMLGGCGEGGGGPAHPFTEFPWRAEAPEPATERLCPASLDERSVEDPVRIECALEGETFIASTPAPADSLVVMAYNVERGFEVDGQLALLAHDPSVPTPDVLLLSEVDRGCARTDRRHVARDYAEALGHAYVYGVEFVELPNVPDPAGRPACEHGNAIVSRYPLGNVRLIRFADNRSWYVPPEDRPADEPRLGGRMALRADVRVGDQLVRVTTLHFESKPLPLSRVVHQAEETADDALAAPYPAVVGGDTNVPLYFLDLILGTEADEATRVFLDRGFVDPHAGLPFPARVTHAPLLVLDLLFVHGAETSAPGNCRSETCLGLSDHSPVWATVHLPRG